MPVRMSGGEYHDRKSFFASPGHPHDFILYLLLQNCGASLSCMCTNTIGSQLEQCMNCLVSAEPTVESEAEAAISGWNEACNGNLSVSSHRFSFPIVRGAYGSPSRR